MLDITDLSRTTISISGQRRQTVEKLTIALSIKLGVPLNKAEIVNAVIDRIDDIQHENLLERIIVNRFPAGRSPLGAGKKHQP
ncbi:hypothetical protein LU604_26145 (plasmid) [Erwinia tracheiphila]|uniref:Uncharacterized protein n=1 Tax=Erwinia tracheiphila TaxID=65700 RepID=A0A345CZW9_9GAMM|nr:hypothetical protein [Erwinia tracheiphila]AXF78986.1 hypothetical protein AV903_26365 [Erwinia tracheiphila]UIA85884.1 hypothetical protein LU604_26145 [Erwinia tracheiphila]UIA94405.1 hypothetical protein LU632_25615 [Erwinia tracheiphila]